MAKTLSKIKWSEPFDLVLDAIDGLAEGTLWQSGGITLSEPQTQILRISYKIIFGTSPADGTGLRFYVVDGDDASVNEIWDANVGPSDGVISATASIAAIKAAARPVHEHYFNTGIYWADFFTGHFDVYNVGTRWQLLVEVVDVDASSQSLLLVSGMDQSYIRFKTATPVAVRVE